MQELAARVGLTFGNASRHVRIFEAGIALETRRGGKRVIDRLAREVEIIGLLRALADNGERNVAEVEHVVASHFRARDAMACILSLEAIALLRARGYLARKLKRVFQSGKLSECR